jgi:hypothetical protein
MVTGAISVTKAGERGIANTGSVKAGTISIDTTTGYGLYSKGGTVEATTIDISNVPSQVGLFLENKATLTASDVLVQNIGNQAIQANHANTITVTNMVIIGSTKNGLRLYNNNNNPTVKIDLLVTYNCTEYGLAAGKQLTNDNLTVTAMYYENCGNGVHGNIKSGVTAAQGIPQAVREALAAKGITLPTSN